MPLDPQVVGLLQRRTEAGALPVELLGLAGARAVFTQSVWAVGAELAGVEELLIPGPAGPIESRLYRPTAEPGLPVVVFLHGGGWALGDIATYDALCRDIAVAAGCVVLAVNFRRAPEDPFPAGFEDALAATAWTYQQADTLRVDGNRLILLGDSAGGNLAAAVSTAARDLVSFPVAAQILVYPPTDRADSSDSMSLFSTGYLLHAATIDWFWDQYLSRPADRDNPYACPLRTPDFGRLPRTLLITAEYDPVRDQAEAYGAALRAAGNDVTISRYAGVVHGFFQMPTLIDRGRDRSGLASGRSRAPRRHSG